MTDRSDREIARLLEAQRRADESSASAFRELLARPARRRRSPARRMGWAEATAVAAAMAAVAILFFHRPSPSTDRPLRLRPTAADSRTAELELPPEAFALVAWKAPTDFLLRTPGAELTSRLPVLVSPASRHPFLPQPKGAER